jgi:hypothetical protein
MNVPAFHQAEHLPRHPAHHQGFAVEVAAERIQRPHDIGDGAVAVQLRVRRFPSLRLLEDGRIGLLHHLLAEVDPDQVVLEDVVVEHVLGGLAEVEDPLAQRRRLDPERHVLRVDGAGGVVVAADPADAAGDEVRVARVLAFHEDAVAAEDVGAAVALRHLAVLEVDLRVDAQAPDDARDRVPVHLHQLAVLAGRGRNRFCHDLVPFFTAWSGNRFPVAIRDAAISAPGSTAAA